MRHKGEFKYEELSRQCDIPAVTIKARVAKGMSIEESVEHADFRQNNGGPPRHEWNGHLGVPAIAKALGISKTTVFYHLKKFEGDIDKAAASIQSRKVRGQVAPKREPVDLPERALPKPELGLWSTALGLSSSD